MNDSIWFQARRITRYTLIYWPKLPNHAMKDSLHDWSSGRLNITNNSMPQSKSDTMAHHKTILECWSSVRYEFQQGMSPVQQSSSFCLTFSKLNSTGISVTVTFEGLYWRISKLTNAAPSFSQVTALKYKNLNEQKIVELNVFLICQ